MSNSLKLVAPENEPFVDTEREFEFPASAVFRAHSDPELFRQWIGPRGLNTRIDVFDCRSGGAYRFVQSGDDGVEYAFRGVFHTVRENEFVLQTFEYEGYPDVVTLEFASFEDLPGGRSKLTGRSVYPSVEAREMYLSDGMEAGIAAGYEQLEELLGPGNTN
ncbi:SRPBCC family protein [Arthrobacter sp. R1-13]